MCLSQPFCYLLKTIFHISSLTLLFLFFCFVVENLSPPSFSILSILSAYQLYLQVLFSKRLFKSLQCASFTYHSIFSKNIILIQILFKNLTTLYFPLLFCSIKSWTQHMPVQINNIFGKIQNHFSKLSLSPSI